MKLNKSRREVLEAMSYMLVVVAALLACDSGSKDDSVKVTPSGEAASDDGKKDEGGDDAPKKEAAKAAKLGDKVSFEDSEWTVLKAEDLGSEVKSNNQFQEGLKSDGAKYIRVSFKVKNLTKKEERVMDHPKLKDSQDREFGTVDSMMFFIPKGKKTMTLEAVPSSLEKEFWAVYEVPKDSKGLMFMARELGFGGKTHPIDLALK